MKYLALGDSYTIGESVSLKDRFPVQLAEQLRKEGFDFNEPQIIAKTGWTTDELLKGIDEADPSNDFDLVTLLIGVNNQYRGRDLENYQKEFEQLLLKAIGFAGGNKAKVIVVSIPDYGVTPFGQKKGRETVARQIDQFNKVKKRICDKHAVKFVNVTDISRMAFHQKNLIAKDDLHPSGEMYAQWVERILPVAISLLNDTSGK